MDKQALLTCNGIQFIKKRHGGTLNTHCYMKKVKLYTIQSVYHSRFLHQGKYVWTLWKPEDDLRLSFPTSGAHPKESALLYHRDRHTYCTASPPYLRARDNQTEKTWLHSAVLCALQKHRSREADELNLFIESTSHEGKWALFKQSNVTGSLSCET